MLEAMPPEDFAQVMRDTIYALFEGPYLTLGMSEKRLRGAADADPADAGQKRHRMVKIFKTVFHHWQSILGNSNRRSFKRTLGAVPANPPAADPGSVRSGPYYSLRRSTHGARPHQL